MVAVSYGVSTELDAVNSILMSVGESPVNTLTVQSPEVVIAQQTLRQCCREVLQEGWKFNTEYEYPIQIDTNKNVVIPNNVLQIDLNHFKHYDEHDVVRRNDNGTYKLYNLKDHTFEFDDVGEDVFCDIIWMIDYEDIPQVFKSYITIRATRIASNRMVNNGQAAELIAQDESLARALATEYDCKQGDYNIFQDSRYRHTPTTTYRPFQVLQRR